MEIRMRDITMKLREISVKQEICVLKRWSGTDVDAY